MKLREHFVAACREGVETMTELGHRFRTGLADRSRRPSAVPAEVEDAIVAARKARPRWGPRKLHAASSFEADPASSAPLEHATAPNKLWCIDFLVGASRCYPLTVTDACTRFLVACIALPNTKTTTVQRSLMTVFDEFGVPARSSRVAQQRAFDRFRAEYNRRASA